MSIAVQEIKEKSALLTVDGNFRGFVSIGNLSDSRVESMYDVLKVGMKRVGVVIAVDKEKMVLDVSLKESLLEKDESWWMRQREYAHLYN